MEPKESSVGPVSFSTQTRISETNDSNTIKIQTGSSKRKCEKKKPNKIKKKTGVKGCSCENIDGSVVLDADEDCLTHSFCVVESLKKKGVQPFVPKGLPWASNKLLYLPGQRPPHFEKSKAEEMAIERKKKKRLKRKMKEKEKAMKKLRKGDHRKLCDVISTSQELMLLMRMISMVMEEKKIARRQRLSGTQTDVQTIDDENEAEAVNDELGGEDKVDDNDEEEEEEENDLPSVSGDEPVVGLLENFIET